MKIERYLHLNNVFIGAKDSSAKCQTKVPISRDIFMSLKLIDDNKDVSAPIIWAFTLLEKNI